MIDGHIRQLADGKRGSCRTCEGKDGWFGKAFLLCSELRTLPGIRCAILRGRPGRPAMAGTEHLPRSTKLSLKGAEGGCWTHWNWDSLEPRGIVRSLQWNLRVRMGSVIQCEGKVGCLAARAKYCLLKRIPLGSVSPK